MIMVTSSSIYVADDMTSNPFYFAQRQSLFIAIGLIAILIGGLIAFFIINKVIKEENETEKSDS